MANYNPKYSEGTKIHLSTINTQKSDENTLKYDKYSEGTKIHLSTINTHVAAASLIRRSIKHMSWLFAYG